MTARLLDSFDQYGFVPQLYASVRSMQYLLDRASPEYQYAHVGPEVDKERYISKRFLQQSSGWLNFSPSCRPWDCWFKLVRTGYMRVPRCQIADHRSKRVPGFQTVDPREATFRGTREAGRLWQRGPQSGMWRLSVRVCLKAWVWNICVDPIAPWLSMR